MAQYRVELRAFRSGEWYTKAETDSLASAVSVAHNHSYGRAYRIIDTMSGTIYEEHDEDQGMKEFMTSKEGYDTIHPLG